MAKVERFEDLECWKAGRDLVNCVFDLCDKQGLAKDFETKAQIKRAAISTMNIVAEGFGRFSRKEFVRYLEISQASAIEVRNMTYIFLDRKYISTAEFEQLSEKSNRLIGLTNGLIRYLKTKSNNPVDRN